jgi:CRP-like cAMP-binding protein
MSAAGNLLLGTLAPAALASLDIQVEEHPLRDILIRIDEVPDFAFFPHPGALVSIVRTMENGSMVEVGVIGGEGLFNVHSLLTVTTPLGSEALVQGEGTFSRVGVTGLRAAFDADAAFRGRLLAFTSLFLEQVTQNAVCNRLHPIERRLAKWLLIVRDRVGSDELQLTHDFLSHMLGVHRPGVSIAVNALTIDGIVEHRRNRIHIRDSTGLVERACECHAALNRRLQAFTAELKRQAAPRP